MRFMMIVKPPPYTDRPPPEELEAMGRFNDELRRAGVLVELNGLEPPDKGAKVKFSGSQRTVLDGPFSETKELIGGYWIIEVQSKEGAVDWAKRIPFGIEVHPGQEVEVEIRQVFEVGPGRAR